MNKFLVLFEKSNTGYGAYAPDLPDSRAVALRTLGSSLKTDTVAVAGAWL
jgi:hypothetical protein